MSSSGFVAIYKELFSKYLVPLLNIVEHACSIGVLGKVRDGEMECELVKDKRYIPEDGHLIEIIL